MNEKERVAEIKTKVNELNQIIKDAATEVNLEISIRLNYEYTLGKEYPILFCKICKSL